MSEFWQVICLAELWLGLATSIIGLEKVHILDQKEVSGSLMFLVIMSMTQELIWTQAVANLGQVEMRVSNSQQKALWSKV